MVLSISQKPQFCAPFFISFFHCNFFPSNQHFSLLCFCLANIQVTKGSLSRFVNCLGDISPSFPMGRILNYLLRIRFWYITCPLSPSSPAECLFMWSFIYFSLGFLKSWSLSLRVYAWKDRMPGDVNILSC